MCIHIRLKKRRAQLTAQSADQIRKENTNDKSLLTVDDIDRGRYKGTHQDSEERESADQSVPTSCLFEYDRNSSEKEICKRGNVVVECLSAS